MNKCLKRRQYACEILFFYMFFHYQKPQQADTQKVSLLRSAKAEKFCQSSPHRPTEIKQLPNKIIAEYVARHHKHNTNLKAHPRFSLTYR